MVNIIYSGFQAEDAEIMFPDNRVNELVVEVWNQLQTPEAIKDLSLPLQENFPTFSEAIEHISIEFVRVVEGSYVPESETAPPDATHNIMNIKIFHDSREYKSCFPYVESRVIHQLGHALRGAIVLHSEQINQPDTEGNDVLYDTPPIAHQASELFMLRDMEAGYWVEHHTRGGVIVELSGGFYVPHQNPLPSETNDLSAFGGYLFFKVVTCQRKALQYKKLLLDIYIGYMFNGTEFETNIVEICVHSKVMARSR